MLKPTENTLSRDQFVKLREVRQRVKDQFDEDFSLQTANVFNEVYRFALQSETNELFRLFSELNEISGHPLERPLNEEQFVLLREAKKLIHAELGEDFQLDVLGVMDALYEHAKTSEHEELLDIYMYLVSREECPPLTTGGLQKSTEAGATDLAFEDISAPDFERLRDAKRSVLAEFDQVLSLHSQSALDDLYGFAVRSAGVEIFELFCELLAPQALSREESWQVQGWLSKEQFDLLRDVRARVKKEFDLVLDLRSDAILSDVYQHSLRASEEDLFNLCWAFQRTSAATETSMLPSKDEFRMLRQARTLVTEEFEQELQLQSDAVEYDLYKYAVSSNTDALFDLHTELMALPDRITPRSDFEGRAQLSREEFVLLRDARDFIQQEFDQHLALENADVLDRLYGFALDSEKEDLFDLHAELNTGATEEQEEPRRKQEQESEPAVVDPMWQSPRGSQVSDQEADTDTQSSKSPKPAGFFSRLFGKSEPEVAPATADGPEDQVSVVVETASVEETPLVEETSLVEETPSVEETLSVEPVATAKSQPDVEVEPSAEADDEDTSNELAEEPSDGDSSLEVEAMNSESPDQPDLLQQAESAEATGSDETAEPTETAESRETVEPAKKDFGDLLVRAMQKERAGSTKSNAGQAQTATPQSAENAAKAISVGPLRSDLKVSDSNWYISTEKNHMQIRLTGPLAVGVDGELSFSTEADEPQGAWFDLVDGDPVVAFETVEVLVNGDPVDQLQALAAGDQIEVAGQRMQLDYLSGSKSGESAISG